MFRDMPVVRGYARKRKPTFLPTAPDLLSGVSVGSAVVRGT